MKTCRVVTPQWTTPDVLQHGVPSRCELALSRGTTPTEIFGACLELRPARVTPKE